MNLAPWAEGPFEIILHGELHFRSGEDFDRRMALISFDNAIEVAITTYLSLHPIQRQNRTYTKADAERWNANFHTKLEFWELECKSRGISAQVTRAHFVWYHELRNKQYHEGSPSTPNWNHLRGLRAAALWVFSELYDVPNVEQVLDDGVAASIATNDKPARDSKLDRIIDSEYPMVQVGGSPFYVSELLHAIDPVAYKELAIEIETGGGGNIRLAHDQ